MPRRPDDWWVPIDIRMPYPDTVLAAARLAADQEACPNHPDDKLVLGVGGRGGMPSSGDYWTLACARHFNNPLTEAWCPFQLTIPVPRSGSLPPWARK